MKLHAALKRYLNYLNKQNYSQRHIETVQYRIKRFVSDVGDLKVNSIKKRDIHTFFIDLEEAGYSRGTLAGYKSTLRAWFHWLKKKHHSKRNLSKHLRGRPYAYSYSPVKSTAVPLAHMIRVIDTLPDYIAHRGRRPRDIRDAALMSLCIDSGARRGELRNIRKSDLIKSLDQPTITDNNQYIYHISSHGKTGPVIIRYFSETAVYLSEWIHHIPPSSPWVFINLQTGRRLQPSSMHIGFEFICRFAEVPTIRFHAIRKRNITDIIRISGDQKIGQLYAGHSSSITTQQYYNQIQLQYVDEAAAQLSSQRRPNGHQLAFNFFGR